MAAGDVIVIKESGASHKGNYFDGTDDYVLHDAHAVARVAANDTVGTYSLWFYADLPRFVSGSAYALISAGDNDSTDQILSIYVSGTSGNLRFQVKVGGATQFLCDTPSNSVSVRRWTHVAFVQDGKQPAIYIDGVKQTITNTTSTDLTVWYDALTNVDKFAIGVQESNATHTADFTGAIGRVKYWNRALLPSEVLADYRGEELTGDSTYLQFNVTNEFDGITDYGLGADNGTLTGHAHYGGDISAWSLAIERNSTGHAAEFINTFVHGTDYISVIKRGD